MRGGDVRARGTDRLRPRRPDGLAPAEPKKLGDGFDDLRRLVWYDATTSWSYFRAIKEIADAVPKLVQGGAPGATELESVKEKLNDKELAKALEGDVYESELPPHVALLDALDDQSGTPRLRIGAAELVYVYPFALEGEGAWVDTALKNGLRLPWLDDDDQPLQLEAEVLERNDVWERPDVLERGYSGASIKLPDIKLTTTDGTQEPLEFKAEVRLSQLGNHYVRVRSRLDDAGLNELNKALRRGSPAMGAESLTWKHRPASDEDCEKFTDYATDLIEMIAGFFGARPVLNLDAQFHVIVAARSISVDGKSDHPTPEELTGRTEDGQRSENPVLGASLLFHPIRHLATSLEEWVRYPAPRPDNLFTNRGYAGDLVVRTENTTVSYMPTSPDWLTAEYQALIEFVASIPPLFSLSEERAKRETKRLDTFLRVSGEEIKREDLYDRETDIRILESDIRQLLATLHSPALCRTGGQREFLNDLWDAADLPPLESGLERQLTLLADRQQRIATLVWRKQQQRREDQNDRLERPVQLVAVVLGVASFAEVLSLFNQVWGGGEIQGLLATAIELGLLLTALVLVLGYLRSKTQ